VLLGISKQESAWSPGAGAAARYESVPDAWVYGDGFAILLESKVNGDFSPGQMEAHYRRLRPIEGAPPVIELTTWKRVHHLFCRLLPRVTDAASRLLVKQFIELLEYCGMSGFTGFRHEHFDYFLLHDDDAARRWILDQVEDFAPCSSVHRYKQEQRRKSKETWLKQRRLPLRYIRKMEWRT
jgi:hypothetical protein